MTVTVDKAKFHILSIYASQLLDTKEMIQIFVKGLNTDLQVMGL